MSGGRTLANRSMWAQEVLLLLLLLPAIAMLREGGKTTGEVRCIETERQALLKFKQGLEKYDNTLSSWTSGDEDCCGWERIKCHNQTNHVIALYLRSDYGVKQNADAESKYLENFGINYYYDGFRKKFGGEIGSSLVELIYLKHLDLAYNEFTRIPNFIGSLTRLRYLNLEGNPISGTIPPQLGNLTRLRFLDLWSDEEMTADNLEWLPQLSSLETLILGTLKLPEPADWLQSIKVAPSLSTLRLFGCQFPYKVAASSLSHLNSSNSLTSLGISNTRIHPLVVPWLLNVSRNLINLSISGAEIRGLLPNSFDNMRSLESIHLSSNELEGGIPNSLGKLCNLKKLRLSNNSLNGTLVDLLESLTGCTTKSLEILNLNDNELGDSFPEFSQFSSLRVLRLADNKLSRLLRESIGHLPNLEILDVSYNNITGVVSEAHLQKLSKLKMLDLSSNSLTLNFDPNWVPPFQLVAVKLNSCKLGATFPSWLGTQLELSGLDISNSGISETIPDWFYNLTPKLRYLSLSNNSIKGTLPELPLTFYKYTIIDFSFNQFHGPVPISLANASALDLSNNKITNFEQFLCTPMSQRPTVFLDISNNQLSGSLPDCWIPWKELNVLNLENNNFSGTAPTSLGSLYQLQILRLRNNNISGNLPSSLKNCSQLMVLDFGENNLDSEMPTWIGEYLTNLIVLCMKSNKLYGRLPSSVCHLGSIQLLDLSLNHISGAIPWCFNNFSSMVDMEFEYYSTTISMSYTSDPVRGYGREYENNAYVTWKGLDYKYDKILGLLRFIDLSSNKLSGEIPREVTNLVGLGQLNLSRNNLSGIIPQNIGQMIALESLDLSHNQLSGEIPMSLANISRLAFLDLSDNKLGGRIPTGTQLQSFDASRYSGNNGLCGPPLYSTCCTTGDGTLHDSAGTSSPSSCDGPGTGHETNSNAHDDDDDRGWLDMDMSWFHMGIGVGFAIGFLGAFGLNLFVNTSWIFNQYWRLCLYGARFARLFKPTT